MKLVSLTTRRCQSGEVDYDGHIIPTRRLPSAWASLRSSVGHSHAQLRAEFLANMGVQLRERIGFKRAAVAVARKLAVIVHAVLQTGEPFDPTTGVTVTA